MFNDFAILRLKKKNTTIIYKIKSYTRSGRYINYTIHYLGKKGKCFLLPNIAVNLSAMWWYEEEIIENSSTTLITYQLTYKFPKKFTTTFLSNENDTTM